MKHRVLVIACALALLPSLALATNPQPTPDPRADADASARADASAEQSQNASAAIGDFEVSSTYKERLQAPAVNAPPIYASGSCAYGASFSVSAPGVGLGGGKAKPDPDCNRRELVRVVSSLNPALALKIACEDPLVVDMVARGAIQADACQYVPPAPPKPVVEEAGPSAKVEAAPVADPQYVTRPELNEIIKRAVGK